MFFFFFQAEDGIRDATVTGVQTCALPICLRRGDAFGIRLAVHEAERVGRDHVRLGLAERSWIGEELDATGRIELEVVAAFLAHPVVALELLVEQHLAAHRTLRPEVRGKFFRLAAEGIPEPHTASSERYQQSPITPGPARAPMTGPASAIQCSTQWKRAWAQSARASARSGSFVCNVQAFTREPGGRRCSISSFSRAVAFSLVRTRSMGATTPSSTSRIGLTARSEPKSAAPPEIRPERLRYSSTSAAASRCTLPARRRASRTASSNARPSRRARAHAVAINEIAPASVRVSTTSMRASPTCCAVADATE